MDERYSRQVLFPGIGREGQDKIRSKHVLMIGAGALGSGNGEILTRAGIGRLTIVDRDYVEASNLQRQQLYTEEDVAEKVPKAAAAEKRLRAINSDVEIKAIIGDATPAMLEDLVRMLILLLMPPIILKHGWRLMIFHKSTSYHGFMERVLAVTG